MVTNKRVYNTRRNSRKNTRRVTRRFRKRKNMVSKRTRSRNFNKRGNRKSNRLNKRNIKGGSSTRKRRDALHYLVYPGEFSESFTEGDYTPLHQMPSGKRWAWSSKVKKHLLEGKAVPKGTVVQLRNPDNLKESRGVNDTLLILGQSQRKKYYIYRIAVDSGEREYNFSEDMFNPEAGIANWVVAGFMYTIEDKNGPPAEIVNPFTGEFAVKSL